MWYWRIYGWDFHISAVYQLQQCECISIRYWCCFCCCCHRFSFALLLQFLPLCCFGCKGEYSKDTPNYLCHEYCKWFFSLHSRSLCYCLNHRFTFIHIVTDLLLYTINISIHISNIDNFYPSYNKTFARERRKIATFTIQLHASINIKGIKNIDFNFFPWLLCAVFSLSFYYHEVIPTAAPIHVHNQKYINHNIHQFFL